MSTWAETVENFLPIFDKKGRSSKPSRLAKAYREVTEAANPKPESIGYAEVTKGWTFERMLGRTLLFEKNGRYRAIKVQREKETVDHLWREFNIIKLFNSEEGRAYIAEESPEGFKRHGQYP